jgi:3,4-dihydroxy 2-butanone 4-phosphate synthase/GTP cyclohydrolase II
MMAFERIQAALTEIRAGRMVILVDDEDRENEGDLVMAADSVSAEAINFMAVHARGLICLTLTEARLQALGIPMMVIDNASPYQTAFTVSIEARDGVSTGISAADRARTIAVAVDAHTTPAQITRPGHIFPLRARAGGVLVRLGHTEGSVDLARLSGRKAAGVICEIINDDGTMARRADLERFGAKHNMPVVSIAELVSYRLAHDTELTPLSTQQHLHPEYGALWVHIFHTPHDDRRHVAIRPVQASNAPPQVALLGGKQLTSVLDWLEAPTDAKTQAGLCALWPGGNAVLVCIDTLGPEASPTARLTALHQSSKAPSHTAVGCAPRVSYQNGIGAQILRHLDVQSMRLVAGQRQQQAALQACGLHADVLDTPKVAPQSRTAQETSRG